MWTRLLVPFSLKNMWKIVAKIVKIVKTFFLSISIEISGCIIFEFYCVWADGKWKLPVLEVN